MNQLRHTLPRPGQIRLPALEEDDPRPEIRLGAIVVGALVLILFGWASFARLDAAAYAGGQVTVAAHRQTLQHREGGVVSAVHVHEGQHVRAGDVLVDLVGGDVQAQARSLASQVIALKAQKARLESEELGRSSIVWPSEFQALTGADGADAAKAMQLEQVQFNARLAAIEAQKGVLRQKSSEIGRQIEGYQRQIEANSKEQKLLGDELTGVQSLAARGYAPTTRVRALQRAQAELGGQEGQYTATIAQSREESRTAQLQILQVEREHKEEVAKDLHEADVQLKDLTPKLEAARDQLSRVQLRAPVSGMVLGLSVFGPGSVMAPGQKLLDIVPDNAPLVIDAQVSPNDADDLHVGQSTEIRFPSVHDRRLPIMKGVLTQLSADSFVDEKTGARYFSARVTVPPSQIAALQRLRGTDVLRPGLPAEVLIPLRRRTVLQYLLEPLNDSLWRSFREH